MCKILFVKYLVSIMLPQRFFSSTNYCTILLEVFNYFNQMFIFYKCIYCNQLLIHFDNILIYLISFNQMFFFIWLFIIYLNHIVFILSKCV